MSDLARRTLGAVAGRARQSQLTRTNPSISQGVLVRTPIRRTEQLVDQVVRMKAGVLMIFRAAGLVGSIQKCKPTGHAFLLVVIIMMIVAVMVSRPMTSQVIVEVIPERTR